MRRAPSIGARLGVAVLAVVTGACSASHGARAKGPRPPARPAPVAAVAPSALVDPFMGTGVGGRAVGDVNASPAADVPFGMMQWGPDTSPDRAPGGGYRFGDRALSGLSLTHLSGPGCPALGDVPILPTLGALGAAPETATAGFVHAHESAAPGRYAVTLDSGVHVELATTTRTGLAELTFPAGATANVLFKAAGSAVPAVRADVRAVGDGEVVGTVTSGSFCDTPGTYHLAFDARFDQPFARTTTWQGAQVVAGGRAATDPHAGLAVSFAATAQPRVVRMKVGISFVDVDNARANLAAENRGWDVAAVERAAAARWDAMLGRIHVEGGTAAELATFDSALYRSLLHPNVFDDANGEYAGFDGRTHGARGYTQYANFSGWDIYRSEVPLLALVAPRETGDMMRSLLADAAQGGWLPKWAYTDVETAEMNGDSADPILADAYAFGARGFDARAALRAMVRGADTPGTGAGWDVERQDLDEYLRQGWVEAGRRDKTSLDYSIGGSETLEYAIDDAAVAQLAAALGDAPTAARFTARAASWRHLFDPATGYLAARRADGTFPPGPAFQPSSRPGIGQEGWEEGNAIQYTWSVPQDLRGLFDLMGGNRVAVAKLDAFFSRLNTSRKEPYDWAGNEPALGIPWEYDYAGAPWRTQDVVRRIATGLYAAAPGGEPGNDDLGAMASWYVWAAIGLYPETPGRADLVLASPMFSRVDVRLGSGRTLTIVAPGASAANRYVRSLAVRGTTVAPVCGSAAAYECPWLPASVLTTGARLDFGLSPVPARGWGSDPAAAPPSMTKPATR